MKHVDIEELLQSSLGTAHTAKLETYSAFCCETETLWPGEPEPRWPAARHRLARLHYPDLVRDYETENCDTPSCTTFSYCRRTLQDSALPNSQLL